MFRPTFSAALAGNFNDNGCLVMDCKDSPKIYTEIWGFTRFGEMFKDIPDLNLGKWEMGKCSKIYKVGPDKF